MSTEIRARSPYYIRAANVTNLTQTQLDVYIYEGVSPADLPSSPQYRLFKKPINEERAVTFEISELIRDYFDNVYTGTYASSAGSVLWVRTIQNFSVSSGELPEPVTNDYLAFDSYTEFKDGVNFGFPATQVPLESTLISKLDGQALYVPVLAEETTQVQFKYNGAVVQTDTISDNGNTNQKIQYPNYTGNVDEVIITSTFPRTYTVETIEECKYPTAKISFVNKYGALQDLWFFKKSVESLQTNKEEFNRNLLSYTELSYSTNAHSKKVLNKTGNKSILLNSGFYSEDLNLTFEQLLVSEYIWMTRENTIYPMVITDSTFSYKTSLNDKLINYSINFEYAFDLINNVH